MGPLLGFLIWNWSPARVSMGDVGSTFLGAVFAGVMLQAPTGSDRLGLLLVAGPLLGDAAICVLRRLAAGQPVFQAHRPHLYQRLHQAGWSHCRVCFAYLTATILTAEAFLGGGAVGASVLAAPVLGWRLWLERKAGRAVRNGTWAGHVTQCYVSSPTPSTSVKRLLAFARVYQEARTNE